MQLDEWAKKWGIDEDAIADLKIEMGLCEPVGEPMTEADVTRAVRLKASREGIKLWRNNVGAHQDHTGRMIRYGLCNESKVMNQLIKSADLIGIKPGGQFIARECKHAGWHYAGTPRETAQLKFLQMVLAMGGDAGFTTGSINFLSNSLSTEAADLEGKSSII